MNLYCQDNHRTAEQLAEMQRLEAAGICLFCPDGLSQNGRDRALWRTSHWSVMPNEFPYEGTSLHLMLIPHQHVGDLIDLAPPAQQDFWNVLAMVHERYDLRYYGLGARNGDCRYTGATIAHLHVHILVADVTTPAEIPVRMRFSSRPAPGEPG